jgi:phage shock protein A
MQEYVKASYQSHPSFVKELSLFMLTERVDPSQLDTLSTKMSEMTALFEKMKREHKALDEKYSILKRSHDAALVDIKNLKAAKKGKQQADTP